MESKYIPVKDLEIYKLARELSKFYYTSRASLSESKDHWLELLKERDKITLVNYEKFKEIGERLAIKINNFIKSTYKAKERNL